MIKKISFSAVCLLLVFTACTAEAQTWDSTHRPASFTNKVQLFKSYPLVKNSIVMLGNSITAGVDWAELTGKKNIINRGISGDISFGVLERLDEVTERKPRKVFILIGINDVSRNIPDSLIAANYRKIIDRFHSESPRTKIYLQTLLPVNNEFTQFKNHYNKDEHISFLNSQIKRLGGLKNVTIIDLHPHFLDDEGRLRKEYTMDGLHLNGAGYKQWLNVLKAHL